MVDKETLYKEYIANRKPMHVIASELGIAIGTVYNYLNKYGIETRNKSDYPISDREREAWAEKRRNDLSIQ
jgi:hypothetical protein